jgi:dipeptidyl aminopeptidase/acylaminoacyl peptidase
MKLKLELFLCLAAITAPRPALAKRPITVEDLLKVERITEPQVSPDGKWIAYVQTHVDLAANKKMGHIWVMSSSGGEPRQLTNEGSDSHPRWSPDSQSLAFVSQRGGNSQIWILSLAEGAGGEPRQLTSISTEADGVTWARKGDNILFVSAVYPDCADDECNKARLESTAKNPVKARLLPRLFFRHWDRWLDGKFTHLFIVSAQGGAPRDLTPGPYDAPTFFLDAPDGYSIAPDGTEVCYSSNHEASSAVAWTTNNDLYIVPAGGGEPRNITSGNPGSDAAPQYSPDGRYIAYTSQARNGYESDLFRLRVYDRQTHAIKDLTTGFDQWVAEFAWAPDSDTIYLVAPDHTEGPILKTSVSHPHVEQVVFGFNTQISVTPDDSALVFMRASLTHPAEIFRAPANGGQSSAVTHVNDALMAELELNPAESVMTKSPLGDQVQSLLIKPPGFDATHKYPGLMLVHGGPQGAWDDDWGYRWNAQVFAAQGYVVMMTNFHGSTGYGQKFVEEISGDWGGAPYQDLMNATDYLANLPYVDKTRLGAAGASFGGFMIDWIAGHTTRFKALVSHDGVFDQRSMYGETEELWFPEWEFKGVPWSNPQLYEKWSPSKYVGNIQTPMLIVEGAKDFRVTEGQAFQTFTALQRRGIPSELLYFDDEGHWVNKPADSQYWYHTVLGWLDRYVKP